MKALRRFIGFVMLTISSDIYVGQPNLSHGETINSANARRDKLGGGFFFSHVLIVKIQATTQFLSR